jgi:hypothetical protein
MTNLNLHPPPRMISAAQRKPTGNVSIQSLQPLPFDSFRVLEPAVNTARTGRNLVLVGHGRPGARAFPSTSSRPSRILQNSASFPLAIVHTGPGANTAPPMVLQPTPAPLVLELSLLYHELLWNDIDTPNKTWERIQRLEGSEL